SGQPAALQLRLLQTVVAVAAEKNSTLVLPFPVELLRFLERAGDRGADEVTLWSGQAATVTPSTPADGQASAPAAPRSPSPVPEAVGRS
ncbi:hypothetical protein ADL00_07105, partial [Streptomyces sp. AS58]